MVLPSVIPVSLPCFTISKIIRLRFGAVSYFITGLKVRIESMKDDLWVYDFHNRLNDSVLKHDCNIIIYVSRVYNNASKHIYLLKNKKVILKVFS